MNQLTFDDFLNGNKELIHCQLSQGYHWIRITSGHTPREYQQSIHFTLQGYDFLYVNAALKDEILKHFEGEIKSLAWKDGIGYGEKKGEPFIAFSTA